jgi:hypothetical protein
MMYMYKWSFEGMSYGCVHVMLLLLHLLAVYLLVFTLPGIGLEPVCTAGPAPLRLHYCSSELICVPNVLRARVDVS